FVQKALNINAKLRDGSDNRGMEFSPCLQRTLGQLVEPFGVGPLRALIRQMGMTLKEIRRKASPFVGRLRRLLDRLRIFEGCTTQFMSLGFSLKRLACLPCSRQLGDLLPETLDLGFNLDLLPAHTEQTFEF